MKSDFCEKNIDYAKENIKGNFIYGDFTNTLPYDNNSFDVVICMSSLFYLKNTNELSIKLNINLNDRPQNLSPTKYFQICDEYEKLSS